jgi:undecaprenyl-diphosphatase
MPHEILRPVAAAESGVQTTLDNCDSEVCSEPGVVVDRNGRIVMKLSIAIFAAVILTVIGVLFADTLGPAGGDSAGESVEQMTGMQAAVLGVVEGLTEYLPVSSTGHLILTQRMMGIGNTEAANAYAICIQLGAIVAVLSLYRTRVKQMALGALNRHRAGQRLLFNTMVAFMPAAVIGLLFDDMIELYLFGLWPIVGAWFVGGAAILAIAWAGKEKFPPSGNDLEHLHRKQALLIGLIQCLAMWPGVSRSLVTIVGGVIVGLSLPAAVEFSFLLGVVTLGAATAYKSLQFGPEMIHAYGWTNLMIGFFAALFSAVAAVKWMVAYLNKHGLSVFGYYRVALALAVGALLLLGVMGS